MPTLRLSGSITAKSPIFITRPEQGDAQLMMNVIRNQMMTQVHVIPGETIKGLLRSTAYAVCVDAGRLAGDLHVSLEQFYKQTSGGISFSSETRELGAEEALREQEPLLSLFGAASPRLTGRLIVQHALAEPAIGSQREEGIGLPPGTRRDGITARPEFAGLLAKEDQQLWSRQAALTSRVSEANQRIDHAKRTLGRARRTEGMEAAEIKKLEADLKAAEDAAAAIKADPEYQQSVQRPIPTKNAAPAGTVYDHSIHLEGGSLIELGLLLATLELWNQTPRIGGGKTTGYGQIEARYAIELLSEASLARDRTWIAAGAVTIGGSGPVIETNNSTIEEASVAWRETENTIRSKTKVFG
jgi:CRISPR/Cas system CSM-associated protein Csm3 (group 7 of RAMP superfamily)